MGFSLNLIQKLKARSRLRGSFYCAAGPVADPTFGQPRFTLGRAQRLARATRRFNNARLGPPVARVTRAILLCFLLFLPAVTHARIYIRIDEVAERKFPIAVPHLTGKDSWKKDIPKIIENDLKLSGLFELLDPDLYPRTRGDSYEPHQVDLKPWQLAGVQAVVLGGISREGDKKVVKLYLYDPLTGEKIVGQSYSASGNEVRTVAHHFSDQIMEALTGFKGIFRTRIAFVSEASRHKEIYLMDMDGERTGRLTNDRHINLSPNYGPKGIVYTSYDHDANANVKTWDGGRGKLILRGGTNISPVWSPAGGITVAMLEHDADIFNITMGGRRGQRLTHSWSIDLAPAWAPGGGSFVFASERGGGLHLFRADAGGGSVQRLTFVGYHNDNPEWSPDGQKIVFQGRDQGVWDLFLINPDGSYLERLTAGTGNNQEPTWAPNSQYIGFSSNRAGGYRIHLMTAQGENQLPISKGMGLQPSWGPFVD